MADYYLMFSEVYKLSQENLEWANKHLSFPSKIEDECEDQGIDIEDHPDYKDLQKYTEDYGINDVGSIGDRISFDYEVDFKNGELWIYSEGYGDVDQAAIFLAKLARKSGGRYHISWSTTCSKPRPDSFYGGAFWITPEGVESINTCDWIEKKKKNNLL